MIVFFSRKRHTRDGDIAFLVLPLRIAEEDQNLAAVPRPQDPEILTDAFLAAAL